MANKAVQTEEREHILTYVGLLDAQVCSRGTEDEALAWLRLNNPAGTSNNWGHFDYEEKPSMKPVRCQTFPDRTHYVFVC